MYSSHRCGVYILQMCDQPCPAHSTHGLATWPHNLPPDSALSRPIAAAIARQAVSFAWSHRQRWGPCGGCDAHVQNVDKDSARRRFPPSLGIVRTVAITPREHGELRRLRPAMRKQLRTTSLQRANGEARPDSIKAATMRHDGRPHCAPTCCGSHRLRRRRCWPNEIITAQQMCDRTPMMRAL